MEEPFILAGDVDAPPQGGHYEGADEVAGGQLTIDELRRYAVTRSLFPPTSLPKALEALGFLQADPIRAPARAQDLTLRHRVTNYRAGDLERRYSRLQVHEDFFINYGFVTDRVFHLMHPRRRGHAQALLRHAARRSIPPGRGEAAQG